MNKKPMAVHEVAKSTGITTRALHYCDEIRYSFLGYGEQILLYVIISNTILKKNLCRAVA